MTFKEARELYGKSIKEFSKKIGIERSICEMNEDVLSFPTTHDIINHIKEKGLDYEDIMYFTNKHYIPNLSKDLLNIVVQAFNEIKKAKRGE